MPTRVLHIVSGLDPRAGGTVAAVKGLAVFQAGLRSGNDGAHADNRVLHVSLASSYRTSAELPTAEELRAAGVHVTMIGPARGPLARHPELREGVRTLVAQADVVHVHGLWEEIQWQAAHAARELGRPYVVSPHGMLDPWSLGQTAVKRWKKRVYMAWRLRRALNGAAAIHFTTRQEADLTRPLQLKSPALVEPLGVDLAEFDPLPAEGSFRQRYAELAGKRIVLFLGRIHPKKGLELLLPAFARSAADVPDAVLVIAGPGDEAYVDRVRRTATELGVAGRVLFTGMLHGARRIEALRDAEVFVLPSYQENFGISVVESLAAGTPVIVSDQVNLHDEVTAGRVGAVVRTDVDELATALRRWLLDSDLRRSAAAAAPAFVRDRYDWRQVVRRWGGHYERIRAAAGVSAAAPAGAG